MLIRRSLVLVFAAMLLLAGCDKSKITTENYEKVKVGMMLSEVTSYLGSKYDDETPSAGYSISGGGIAGATRAPENVYVFKAKDMKIIVTVKDGKVVQKSKVDL